MDTGSRTIRAPVLRAVGVPMVIEELTLLPPSQGEVVVRLVASGVCHSCLHAMDGSLQGTPMPIVLGDEGAGVVEEVGPGANELRPGDHVVISWAPGCGACRECLRGRPARCRREPTVGYLPGETTRFRKGEEVIYHFGPATFSPYVVVPARGAIKITDSIPLQQAALVGCSVSTGAGAVLRTARVECGQSVAVIGCGGVGLNAVHAASLVGAYPIIAIDPVALKLDVARRLGATATIPKSGTEMVEAIRSASDGGADVVIVAVGSSRAIEHGVEALGAGGKCVVIGAPPTGEMLSIDPQALRAEEKTLVGSSYGSCNPPLDFPMFLELYQAGRYAIDDLVSRVYQLGDINEAFENLANGKDLRGLIVFDEVEP